METTRFHSVVFVRSGAEEAGPGHAAPGASKELAALFRKRLLDLSETFKEELPAERGVSVQFKRVGETAGLAAWGVGAEVVAVTILLGGFDEEEDERAVAKAGRLPTERPLKQDALETIRKRSKPLHALLHCGEGEGKEAAVGEASATLAAVFFSLLGATAEK